jgi:hypothetical protein
VVALGSRRQPVSACVQDVLFGEGRKTSASPRQTKLNISPVERRLVR